MRRVKELIAILMVGDGVLALVASRGHSLLWRFGPGAYKRTLEGLVRRPLLTRALAVVEFGAGLWPALGQYEQR